MGAIVSNIKILEEILEQLYYLDGTVKDKYIKCAIGANIIKYKKQLEDIHSKNAMNVIEYKLKHLTDKLI